MRLDFGPGDGEDVAIRVAVIGDHLLVLQAVSATVRGNPDVEVVASDTGDTDLLRLVRETRPNVVILDGSRRLYCDESRYLERLGRRDP
jgi:chemotaxis response regulator CheB